MDMDDNSDSDSNGHTMMTDPCCIAHKNRKRHGLYLYMRNRLCLFVLFVRRLE